MCCVCLVTQSCLTLWDPMGMRRQPSPGKNTGEGCYPLLQGIFPTQGSNQGLSHCRWILCQLNHKGSLFLGNNTREKNNSCRNEAEFLPFVPWNFLLCSGVVWRNYCHLQNWLENWLSRICLEEVVYLAFWATLHIWPSEGSIIMISLQRGQL